MTSAIGIPAGWKSCLHLLHLCALRVSAVTTLRVVHDLATLTKPRITAATVVAAAAGWAAAGGAPTPRLLGVLGGLAVLSGAACTLNMAYERFTDARMQRTAARPLASGRLPLSAALALALVLVVTGVLLLSLAATPSALSFGILGLLTYAGVYTPLKRRTAWAFALGLLPGALPPVVGWAAAGGGPAGGLLLALGLAAWQIPHVLALSLWLDADYARAGIRTWPRALGESAIAAPRTRRLAAWLTVPAAILMAAPAAFGLAGPLFVACALAAGARFVLSAFRKHRDEEDAAWGRRVFLASLIHVIAVYAALVADRWLL